LNRFRAKKMSGKYLPPEVTIWSFQDSPICDVVVVVRGQEMILRPTRNPATCHFFCTQIEIDFARRLRRHAQWLNGGMPDRRAVAPSLNLLYGKSAAARRR
jgi:hypothetical protein